MIDMRSFTRGVSVALMGCLTGCGLLGGNGDGNGGTGGLLSDVVVLEGEGGSGVTVSPRLQGRLLTLRVGSIESTALVNDAAIAQGETDPHFNNFGGADRFWLGPEAGQYGLYFPQGAEFNRETWVVPADLDKGAYRVTSRDEGRVVLQRHVKVTNYIGTEFSVDVVREIGTHRAADLPTELGIQLPEGIAYAGAYSKNTIFNKGPEPWSAEKGLVGIWILGQFKPSDSAVVIAPFRPGDEGETPFNDDYFGKVSVETPERLKVLGNAVLFRADSRRVGKFGLSQARTTGLAGSIDFEKRLLTVVKFDVPDVPERYGNSTWVQNQPEPYNGDVFQSYNNGNAEKPGELAEVPFYELESTSPVRPLAPGEALTHRHATHHFQGELQKLSSLAQQLLGVNLAEVRQTMLVE